MKPLKVLDESFSSRSHSPRNLMDSKDYSLPRDSSRGKLSNDTKENLDQENLDKEMWAFKNYVQSNLEMLFEQRGLELNDPQDEEDEISSVDSDKLETTSDHSPERTKQDY